MLWKKRNEVIKMKKNKLSIVALIISPLPFITGLIALNIISILCGFGISISLIKNPKRRDIFSIIALCICAFFALLMVGILAFGFIYTFM